MPKPRIVKPHEDELEIGKPRVIAASKSERRIRIPEKIFIHLYTDRPHSNLRLNEVSDYLQKVLGKRAVIDMRGDFVKHHYGDNVPEEVTKKLAETKAWGTTLGRHGPLEGRISTPEEKLDSEKTVLQSTEPVRDAIVKSHGVKYIDHDYYHIRKIHEIFNGTLNKGERDGHMHIVFSSRGLGDDDLGGDRLHMRVGYFGGSASIISTTGITEAPAEPSEYSIKLHIARNTGILTTDDGKHFIQSDDFVKHLRELHRDKMLLPNDERLTEVMKGYALQAVKAHLTGSAFCSDVNCRLFDAHQQEHMIQAQIKSGKLCQKHDDFFRQIREGKREVML